MPSLPSLQPFVLLEFNRHLKSGHGRVVGIGWLPSDAFASFAEPFNFGDAKTGRKSIGTAGVVSSPHRSTPIEAEDNEVQKTL